MPSQIVLRVGDGASIDEVNATFFTQTRGQIEGTRSYLVEVPPGVAVDDCITGILGSLLCDVAEPNYMLQPPEAEQGFVAFFEGDFNHGDYVDQEALTRIGGPAAHLEPHRPLGVEDQRPLYQVGELAHIARPGVVHELVDGAQRQLGHTRQA